MFRFLGVLVALALAACSEEPAPVEKPVRALKTYTVSEAERATVRRFPAVLEPAELNILSFEAAGKLQQLGLSVGQRLSAGEEIARLDPASLILQVETAQAGVEEATAAAENAADTLGRQEELMRRGATTQANVDDAKTKARTSAASLAQARKSLESAEQNLDKSVLKMPFDGVINSVDVVSFSTVSAGTPIASVYPADRFEVSFSVNFDTVNRLVVGKPAKIRLADRPDITLDAVVSEIGSRADSVSSFPVVMELRETHPLLKAGMAVEAALEFELPAEQGYRIPLSAFIKDGHSGERATPDSPARMGIFVYDAASGTVKRRDVAVGGVIDNSLIVIDGLAPGDKVASAGVSFLVEGQKVKLLQDGE